VRVINVPVVLRQRFEHDPAGSLRKWAAESVQAISPFFHEIDSLINSIDKKRINPFNDVSLRFHPDFRCDNNYSRYVHIDLASKHNAIGICMVHVPKFVNAPTVGGTQLARGVFPYYVVDFLGRIQPQNMPSKEFDPDEAREIIVHLRDVLNFPIMLITYDQFQSLDSIHRLRSYGFIVEVMSIDRTTHGWRMDIREKNKLKQVSTKGSFAAPMETMRLAIQSGRVSFPFYGPENENYIVSECKSLEMNYVNGCVGHAPHSRDDLVQAVAGAIFNASLNEHFVESSSSGAIDHEQFEEVPDQRSDIFDDAFEIGGSDGNDQFFTKREDWE